MSEPMVRVLLLDYPKWFGGELTGTGSEWKWVGSARRRSELLAALISDAAKAQPGGASIRTEVMS